MSETSVPVYKHLGPFSDLVAAGKAVQPLFPLAPPGAETRRKAREVLSFTVGDEQPRELRTEHLWQADGVSGEEISWSVGFGPRTHSFVLKPVNGASRLPGIVALHDHGHYKFFGKEKIANGPDGPLNQLVDFRKMYYGGRAYANLLAREGYVVLVHDTFLWGSRKFPLECMPERERALARAVGATLDQELAGPDIVEYNGAAYLHEHLISKYCTQLGTCIAAVIAYEDRVALNYFRSRDDVDAERIACMGLSGGGMRTGLLQATSNDLAACVVVGLMSTYDSMFDDRVAPHSWMSFPTGWSRYGDLPDLAASGAPTPLLVQYLLDDDIFTVDGMRGADERIAAHYAKGGAAKAYTGQFYPGPHRFDAGMQDVAFAWLKEKMHLARDFAEERPTETEPAREAGAR